MKIFKFFGWDKKVPVQVKHPSINFQLFNTLSDVIVREIIRNAEVRFNSTVDDINRLKDISYKLITVFISLLSVLITLYFSDNISLGWVDKKMFSLLYLINIAVLMYCVFQLIMIALPSNVMLKGEEPLKSNYDNLLAMKAYDQEINWNYHSLYALQDKIDFNDSLLDRMNDRLENVITTSSMTFFITLIFSITSQLF